MEKKIDWESDTLREGDAFWERYKERRRESEMYCEGDRNEDRENVRHNVWEIGRNGVMYCERDGKKECDVLWER